MIIELRIPANPEAFKLAPGETEEQAIVRANQALADESKKHFGAGKISVGKLADGRFYFHHIALGTMVRIPEGLDAAAAEALKRSIVPAVKVSPPDGSPPVRGFHGIWARRSFADSLALARTA